MSCYVSQIRTAHYKYLLSTEKEVVRKSFLLMGTGGLRGCMISHSTDANPPSDINLYSAIIHIFHVNLLLT